MSEGEIRKVNKEAGKLTIRHGELKNLEMPPMTMVFQVKDEAMLDQVQPGDKVRVDLRKRTANMLVSKAELDKRRKAWKPNYPASQTPWQEIYRATVGQLDGGGCLELALDYQDLVHTKGIPRDSH